MHKFFFLGLVMALVIFAIPSTAHANLLANSGFETWGPWGSGGSEVPGSWWHLFSDPNVTGTKESVIKQSGSFSGKTTFAGSAAAWGGWGQRVSFTAGNTLYAYQPVNIPTTLGGTNSLASLEITFESAPDVPIGSAVKTVRSTATSGWEALTYSAVAPSGTTSVKYVVLLETWGSGTGNAYWDNSYADAVPIPEPTSLLLLGSGLVGMFITARRKR